MQLLPELRILLSNLTTISSPYLVGGCVRDSLLGLEPKDWDIEVFGVEFETLEKYLQGYYGVDKVISCGKSFGVLKVKSEGIEFDIALPRKEIKTGLGYKGFEVTPDPSLSLREACLRRDFTINALMYDPHMGQVLDFFGGQQDLKYGILRAVSPTSFAEDPLRLLRGFQFCARFGLVVEESTKQLAKQITKAEWDSITPDRIWVEWEKFLLKGTDLYLGLQALEDLGIRQYYPQLQAMVGSMQNPKWHPEGDVWTHTKYVAYYAGSYTESLSDLDRLYIRLAAICHDLGKPETQCVNKRGTISNPKHESCVSTIVNFLNLIHCPEKYHNVVISLVKEHLNWSNVHNGRNLCALVERLAPATLYQLILVAHADMSGRPPLSTEFPSKLLKIHELAKELHINTHRPGITALVTGADLIALGFVQGPHLGAALKQTKEMQIKNPKWTKEQLLTWVEKQLKRGDHG